MRHYKSPVPILSKAASNKLNTWQRKRYCLIHKLNVLISYLLQILQFLVWIHYRNRLKISLQNSIKLYRFNFLNYFIIFTICCTWLFGFKVYRSKVCKENNLKKRNKQILQTFRICTFNSRRQNWPKNANPKMNFLLTKILSNTT